MFKKLFNNSVNKRDKDDDGSDENEYEEIKNRPLNTKSLLPDGAFLTTFIHSNLRPSNKHYIFIRDIYAVYKQECSKLNKAAFTSIKFSSFIYSEFKNTANYSKTYHTW